MKVIPFSNLLRSGFCPPYARLIVACLFFPLIFLSCKKDKAVEISDLKFPLDTYYVPVGGELSIDVQQGNQKYTVSAKDDKLLQTTIQTANPPAGNLRISGLKKGNTQLTVRDEVTGQSAVLQIHVVDPYLVLKAENSLIPYIEGANTDADQSIRKKIRDDSQKFGNFQDGEFLILRNNATQQFSTFKSEADIARGIIDRSGTYHLKFDNNDSITLALTYDNREIAEFPISASSAAFPIFTDFSQEGRVGTQPFSPKDPYPHIYLIRDFTTYFQTMDTRIKQVKIYQSMDLFIGNRHLNFGKGILE
ncbi:hypothetical protein [Chitinophaga defluvii]|uniref:Ig-like protein group 2 n=1 Tax=Chitinophaga defluvii TaxID=3163343 RepID=A0ABV2T576_9BACT